MRRYLLTIFILCAVAVIFIGIRLFQEPTSSPEREELFEHELIEVYEPQPHESVTSPLNVSGVARGYWFFEASAPVVVTDWDGLIIGEGYIEATDDWMTEEYVPFIGSIEFDIEKIRGGYSHNGIVVFKKDNPSGLPEHDDAFEIPVIFSD